MSMTTVEQLNATIQKTQLWLKELTEEGHFENESQAYTAFRAVLHSLRDRLTVEEAVHLAGQLPMLVRGFYYEGWRPSLAPNQEETREEFFQSIEESLGTNMTIDPHHATRAVFALLDRKFTGGLVEHVTGQLPEAIRELWTAQGVDAGE